MIPEERITNLHLSGTSKSTKATNLAKSMNNTKSTIVINPTGSTKSTRSTENRKKNPPSLESTKSSPTKLPMKQPAELPIKLPTKPSTELHKKLRKVKNYLKKWQEIEINQDGQIRLVEHREQRTENQT